MATNVLFFCSLWLGQQQVWKTRHRFMREERRESLERSIGFVGLGRCVGVCAQPCVHACLCMLVCVCVCVCVCLCVCEGGVYFPLFLLLPSPSFLFNCNKVVNTGRRKYASSPSSLNNAKKLTNTWTNMYQCIARHLFKICCTKFLTGFLTSFRAIFHYTWNWNHDHCHFCKCDNIDIFLPLEFPGYLWCQLDSHQKGFCYLHWDLLCSCVYDWPGCGKGTGLL